MRPFLLALALVLAPLAALAAPLADYSGLASFGSDRMLVVSDTKSGSPAPRVSLLEVGEGGVQASPLPVSGWEEDPPNDLEACAPVPGTPDQFLVAESGFYKGRFGRIFRIQVERTPEGWKGTVLGAFRPREAAEGASTPSEEQYEGLALFAPAPGQVLLVLGERGGGGHPGRLCWGFLEGDSWRPAGSAPLDLGEIVAGGRACADLQVVATSEGWTVLTVTTLDPGDLGPFRSAICEIGAFRREAAGALRFEPAPPRALWRVEGSKVEALAPTPATIGGSPFCVGTDDEAYGGTWRPLPAIP